MAAAASRVESSVARGLSHQREGLRGRGRCVHLGDRCQGRRARDQRSPGRLRGRRHARRGRACSTTLARGPRQKRPLRRARLVVWPSPSPNGNRRHRHRTSGAMALASFAYRAQVDMRSSSSGANAVRSNPLASPVCSRRLRDSRRVRPAIATSNPAWRSGPPEPLQRQRQRPRRRWRRDTDRLRRRRRREPAELDISIAVEDPVCAPTLLIGARAADASAHDRAAAPLAAPRSSASLAASSARRRAQGRSPFADRVGYQSPARCSPSSTTPPSAARSRRQHDGEGLATRRKVLGAATACCRLPAMTPTPSPQRHPPPLDPARCAGRAPRRRPSPAWRSHSWLGTLDELISGVETSACSCIFHRLTPCSTRSRDFSVGTRLMIRKRLLAEPVREATRLDAAAAAARLTATSAPTIEWLPSGSASHRRDPDVALTAVK